jgi:UDP-GlcNAc:undecaprenyl-phosphate GlcNAc-1-phosphate transferase
VGFTLCFLLVGSVYLLTAHPDFFIKALPIFISAIIVFAMGVVDDFRELRARTKLIGQCVASLIPVVFGFQFTQFGPIQLGFMGKIITFVWFVGLTNALNLIDGIDALCGSISLSILLAVGVILQLRSSSDYTALLFILSASVLGFLVYNKPTAKIFMGDGGSQFLGFMIAAFPLFRSAPELNYNIFPAMVVLAAIPIMDTIAAIWRRTREGRSFFSPDKAHLHHKLLDMGYTPLSILGLLVVIQVGLCVVSLIVMLWIDGLRGFLVLLIAFLAMIIFFSIIHYTSHTIKRLKKNNTPQSKKYRGKGANMSKKI